MTPTGRWSSFRRSALRTATDGPWDEAAKAIERLGGTRQVFNAMNAVDPRALNGENPSRKGPYAFVGRVGSPRRWPRRATRWTACRAGFAGC